MLSQSKAIKENGSDVKYPSRKDKNKSRDLPFHVEIREGFKLQFTANKKGLHVLNCKYYFGVGKDGFVFGKKT